MNVGWKIPAGIEDLFREALDYASKRRVSDLHAMADRLTREQIAGCVGMCGLVSAYIAIDVVSRRWPTDDGLRLMAEKTVEGENPDEQFGVTAENVYLFLSQCAIGFKTFAEIFAHVFDDPYEFFGAPFFLTIDVLSTFVPNGYTIWDFLDVIEDAYEKAWQLDLNLLPALMVRARIPQPNGD